MSADEYGVSDVTTPEYAASCVRALSTGLTRKALVELARGMPYLGESKKHDIAVWLVRYRPQAMEAIGWWPPKSQQG